MSARAVEARTPLPERDDPYIRVWVRGQPWDVFYAAGRPTWVGAVATNGCRLSLYDVASWPYLPGDAAEALRQAEAFLEQLRLPAVAS